MLNMKFIFLTSSHALLLQELMHLLHGAASSLQIHNLVCCTALTDEQPSSCSGEVTRAVQAAEEAQGLAGLGCLCHGRNIHLPLTWLTC